MIFRFLSAILLVWLLGFVAFAMTLPGSAGKTQADAAIVLTGGPGRIQHGIELLDDKLVKEVFVSGVDPEVKPDEFAREFNVSRRQMQCCVMLGYQAVDTRSNAAEASLWMAKNQYDSVRLVTTDWHMRRAAAEMRQALSPSIRIIPDAVAAKPPLGTLFVEYNKFIASAIYRLLPF